MKPFLLTLSLSILSCQKEPESTQIPTPAHFADGLDTGVNFGLASGFTNDEGIGDNPYVIAVENFETGEVTIPTEENRYAENVTVTSGGYRSSYAAQHLWPEGLNGPTCRFILPDSVHNDQRPTYFVRMYFKYDASFHPYWNTTPPEGTYKGVGVKGFGIYNEEGPSSANTPCDGTNWYCASVQFVGWGPSAKPVANDKYLWVGHLYSYNPAPEIAHAALGEIKISTPSSGGEPYRFSSYATPFEYIQYDEWNCYEVGLYLNTPGRADGEARFWINGVLQSRTTNMVYRTVPGLFPTSVHLNLHRTTDNFPHEMIRFADNIVIATRYIGPAGE